MIRIFLFLATTLFAQIVLAKPPCMPKTPGPDGRITLECVTVPDVVPPSLICPAEYSLGYTHAGPGCIWNGTKTWSGYIPPYTPPSPPISGDQPLYSPPGAPVPGGNRLPYTPPGEPIGNGPGYTPPAEPVDGVYNGRRKGIIIHALISGGIAHALGGDVGQVVGGVLGGGAIPSYTSHNPSVQHEQFCEANRPNKQCRAGQDWGPVVYDSGRRTCNCR